MSEGTKDPRLALVTGSNQGIGLAIARRFAADGMTVIINGKRSEAVEATASALREEGLDAIGIPGDVSVESDVLALFRTIEERFGGLDILVNNAGISLRVGGRKPGIEDVTSDIWTRTFAVNVNGTFFACRAAVPLMRKRARGWIVNLVSQAGRVSTGFGSVHYSASKGAIIAMSRVLASDLGQFGITVNCVSPGRIKTAMAATFAGADQVDQQYIVRTPLGRVGQPEDVTGAVSYLVSPGASFVTGTIIDVTGGFYMP